MFGNPGKTAWRLLAAVPFVLLLGIVGIKVTAGDPSSPFNKIPGAQTIQELGDDAPSTNVTVKLPKTAKPTPSASSSSASALASASASAAASTPAAAATTKVAAPKPEPTRSSDGAGDGTGTGGGGGGSTPTTTPTSSSPTPLTEQQKCEAKGGHWRNFLGNWSCWGI